ncbi:GIY-YIG nuclease family protein [Lutibacter citreus]|uniref:GIY-YIG nuclease family protein n=1 Tax=Lutibacter citreus TaxID=2138210 RepID=UPI000DBE3F3E|nr:GIY-YIG nuclease family protein [Lutibacter citreus]
MECTSQHNYTLFISGPEDKRIIYTKKQEGKKVNFQKPVTTKYIPKIYILTSNNRIVYVGYTGQSIGSRLNYGMRANGKNGYHGYKWKKELDTVNLHVFVFESFVQDEDQMKKQMEFVEAIEAEIVFKVRDETGSWPKYQNEIHFNNQQPEKVKRIANEIYEKIIA